MNPPRFSRHARWRGVLSAALLIATPALAQLPPAIAIPPIASADLRFAVEDGGQAWPEGARAVVARAGPSR